MEINNVPIKDYIWDAWVGQKINYMQTTQSGFIIIGVEDGRGLIIDPKDISYVSFKNPESEQKG